MIEKIESMATDKATEIVLDTARGLLSGYKKKKQWNKLFIDTNEFLLKKVESGDKLLNEIAEYLSSDEMIQLAQKLTKENKYNLFEKLHDELTNIMMKYEIPANEAHYYISSFMSIIFHELEMVNPDVFQCAYLGNWRKNEEKTLEEVKKALSDISNTLIQMNSHEVAVYTPEQIEVSLYKETKEPSINLDFFEIDDELFKEDFLDSLSEENIYVKGQCKEETILCILNELRCIKPDKLVLVVKKEEEWKKLRLANENDEGLGEKILIPWFYADQILAIPHNTNIFVFGSEEHPVGKKTIEMRKRKRGTIIKKLEKLGMDYEDAYRFVEDTHGLYIPMKRKLINGIDIKKPDWMSEDKQLIIPLLLCGKWNETEGDLMVIEELCGKKYKDILEFIRKYINGEEPLFVRFREHGREIVRLASTENAWGFLDDYVNVESEVWKKYVELISEVVTEENPAYNFPTEQQVYAHILPGGAACWSNTLKEGLLRSLVMKAYYNNKPQNQRIVDNIVTTILDNVNNKKKWLSIAKVFPILCEASPCAVRERLDVEWANGTGLKEVFTEQKDGGIWAKNEYVNYIWGIEYLLCQKEYAAWSIRWFFKMNELRRKYPISNSPFEVLETVFCSWLNVTVLTQDEKITLAKEAFEKGFDVWDLFYSELPGIKTSIINTISKPKYRMALEPIELTNEDISNAYKEYTKLCIDHMDFMISRWEKIIGCINHFDNKSITLIIDKLLYEIQSMDDTEKISIKEKIRDEIYRNRFYKSSSWAMKESGNKMLEDALSQIQVGDQIYEYRYLFKNGYNFPLINPIPYSEDESHKDNKKLAEEEIIHGLNQFKENGLDVIRLANICSEYEYSTLGVYLFTIYSEGIFDKDLFVRMVADKTITKIMLDYVRTAYQHSQSNLQIAYHLAKENKTSDDIITQLLLMEIIDNDKQPLIMNESEDVKRSYWKSFRRGLYKDNKKTVHFVIDEMLKYSDHMCLLEILDDCKKYFSEKELLELLENIKKMELGNLTSISRYHVEELVSRLQDSFINTDECIRVAMVELSYRGLLNVEQMKCLNKCLRVSPELYLQMIAILFKTDDGKKVDEIDVDENITSSIYSLYHDLKFCPAEEDGKIKAEKLKQWITEFEEGLIKNRQLRMADMVLGKLFAYSPKGKDGFCPAEEVRAIIEGRNSKTLENEYATAVFNSRGVYSSSGGNEERRLALMYKENADGIRVLYPVTAKIYDDLYERYIYEADLERESDEYAGI